MVGKMTASKIKEIAREVFNLFRKRTEGANTDTGELSPLNIQT